MTIEAAINILNDEYHQGFTTWAVAEGGYAAIPSSLENFRQREFFRLTIGQAVAVAEKYEREAGRDKPATRRLINHIKSAFSLIDRLVDGQDYQWMHTPQGKTISTREIDEAIAEWEKTE